MNYEFPNIYNIDDVLWAIEGRDEFVVAKKEGYTVINYNVMMSDTFPGFEGTIEECILAAVRRECRGIIFDSETGNIIRRPFHKFFNVNEREETQAHIINMSNSHAILEKLDGSMIAPFIVNGEMIWGTKMGATDVAKPVEAFVNKRRQYIEFADALLTRGFTPIFEWCSRKQRIVLDYAEDQLILTAVRNMVSGEYVAFENLKDFIDPKMIPVVRHFQPETDMKEFVEYVRDLELLEGFVVRFNDGHMLKLKCHWYLQIHKAKEAILQDRNIVELILDEKLDDVKAHLPAEECDRLTQFEHDFNQAIKSTYERLIHIAFKTGGTYDRKTFALEVAPKLDQYSRAVLFKRFGTVGSAHGGDEFQNEMRNIIKANLTKTVKYEAIRDVWFKGIVFNV